MYNDDNKAFQCLLGMTNETCIFFLRYTDTHEKGLQYLMGLSASCPKTEKWRCPQVKKILLVAVLIVSLFTPLLGQAAPLSPEEQRRQQQRRPQVQRPQQQRPQVQRPPQQQRQVQRPPQQQRQVQRPPQQQRQVQRPDSDRVRPGTRPGTRDGVRPGTRPGVRPGTRDGVRPGTRDGVRPGHRDGIRPGHRDNIRRDPHHRRYAPPRHGERLRRHPPTRFRPHPRYRPHYHRSHWTPRHYHYHHNHIRRYWVGLSADPLWVPAVFTLVALSGPTNLEVVRPGTYYYRSNSINFVVPAGHVVLSQDQVWYPGDTVESEEFAMLTEEAYTSLNDEPVPDETQDESSEQTSEPVTEQTAALTPEPNTAKDSE